MRKAYKRSSLSVKLVNKRIRGIGTPTEPHGKKENSVEYPAGLRVPFFMSSTQKLENSNVFYYKTKSLVEV